MMKYKVGDKVKIREGLTFGNPRGFVCYMSEYCGRTTTIKAIGTDYYILNNCNGWCWTDEMLEDAGCAEGG